VLCAILCDTLGCIKQELRLFCFVMHTIPHAFLPCELRAVVLKFWRNKIAKMVMVIVLFFVCHPVTNALEHEVFVEGYGQVFKIKCILLCKQVSM
jgi:hypothetical protein